MGIDIRQLIERDHGDLMRGLDEIARATTSSDEARVILDGLRLLATAHAGAQATVLRRMMREAAAPEQLEFLIAQSSHAHAAHERELDTMARLPEDMWPSRARRLRELVRQHHWHEQAALLPMLRERLTPERYRALASEYATDRLCLVTALPRTAPAAHRRTM